MQQRLQQLKSVAVEPVDTETKGKCNTASIILVSVLTALSEKNFKETFYWYKHTKETWLKEKAKEVKPEQ